ncbi:MAG: hypothetical protein AAB276_04580, partial [Pseudomonadota bacterium]
MKHLNCKSIITIALLGLFVTTFLGCVNSAGSRVPGKNYTATDPEKVEVFYQEPQRAYEVVGFVSIDRAIAGSDTSIERKYRTVASTMGADAVIVEMLPKTSYFGPIVQGKGKAIKWKSGVNYNSTSSTNYMSTNP